MATIQWHFSLRIVDGLNVQGFASSLLALPDTVTAAQVQAALATWASAMNGCLSGAPLQATAVLTPALPGGLNDATGATWLASRLNQTGIFDFSNTSTNRRYGQAIPALSSALISGAKVDNAAAAVQALVALLTSPVLGGAYTNESGEALVGLLAALLGFRQHSEQMAALTATS